MSYELCESCGIEIGKRIGECDTCNSLTDARTALCRIKAEGGSPFDVVADAIDAALVALEMVNNRVARLEGGGR